MRDFRKLDAWRKAYDLCLLVYRCTAKFPSNERFGLTSQAQRAAVSIPANMAEGCGRDTDADAKRFFQIAMGSASELECHLMLARDLGYLSPQLYAEVEPKLVEVKRMLGALIVSIRRPRPTDG